MKVIALVLISLVLAVQGFDLIKSTVKPLPDTEVLQTGLEVDDHYLSFGTICRNKEYPFEQHKVRTYDGYFLTMFRIPGKKGEKLETAIAAKRPVVLLWHGLLDSADTWIINDEDKAPAFILANRGYDVWVANSRGNKYSRQHRYLNPDNEADEEVFFGYSFEDMANHDTNSTVAYILKETTKTTLGVIGHGHGATQFLLAPQTGISVLVSLGGMSILNNTQERLITLLAESDYYINKLHEYKINELFPANFLKETMFAMVCQTMPAICEYLVDDVLKIDADYINTSRIDEMLAHYPAGTSLKNLLHLVQIYKNKRFARYDYGLELNRRIYNRDTPPEFDMTKVSNMKIIQIVGEEDHIAKQSDNHWLRKQLGTKVIFYGSYRIGHYSFTLGKDMAYLDRVIALFDQNKWA